MRPRAKIGQNTGPQFIVAAVTLLDRGGRFDDAMNKDYIAPVAEGGAEAALALGTYRRVRIVLGPPQGACGLVGRRLVAFLRDFPS